jgi:uncharacterized protein YjbI with pentapeptide repeats
MEEIEIEAKLIEQEHRLFSIILNMYEFRRHPRSDIRKVAAFKALLYKLLLGGGQIIVLGGILSVATLYFTAQQTRLLSEQNQLLRQELDINAANIREQRWAENLQRRADLVNLLYENNEDTNTPAFSSRERANALVEYITLQSVISAASYSKFRESGEIPLDTAMYKFGIDLTHVNLQNVNVSQIDFRKTVLDRANFSGSRIYFGNFNEVALNWADLSNSYLRGSDFKKAILHAVDLRNADLSNIEWNERTLVAFANIHGVKNAPDGFIEWALDNGAVSMESSLDWETHRNQLLRE